MSDTEPLTGKEIRPVRIAGAVAAADDMANPSAPQVIAHLMGFDGATHDRVSLANRISSLTGASGAALAMALAGQTSNASPSLNIATVLGPGTADAAGLTAQTQLIVTTLNRPYNGVTHDMERTPVVFKTVALGSATAEATIWTPAAGKKFRLMGFMLMVSVLSTLTFKDNTAGTTILLARGNANDPLSLPAIGNGILSAVANNVLTVTRSVAATLDGTVWGTEE